MPPEITNTTAPAPKTSMEPKLNAVTSAPGETSSLDDLIPAELRDIVQKTEKEAKDKEEKPDEKKITKSEGDKVEGKPVAKAEAKTVGSEDKTDDGGKEEEELDVSSENIKKLIEGDPDAVVKKKEEPVKDDTPFWHEEESYKKLLKRVEFTGVKKEDIDTIIREVTDKKTLENGKYVGGLESELEALKQEKTINDTELNRLKQIERSAHFDSLEEVKTKYHTPMAEAATQIKRILDIEGVNISLSKLLAIKDRATFTETLKNVSLDDETALQLSNYWRSYKDLEFKYNTDKVSAQQDLRKHLSTNIPEETVTQIFRNSLGTFINADPKYSYIKEAVADGIEKHPEIQEILGRARNNFTNMLHAISNPSDFSKNSKWLHGLANYILDSAHNGEVEKKYYEVKQDRDAKAADLFRLVSAYKKLLSSAKGIDSSTGKKGTTIKTNGKLESDSDILEEFQGFLKGDIKIDDLIPR